MKRREFLLALLVRGLPGRAARLFGRRAHGWRRERPRQSQRARARLSVDEESQTAKVRILERPNDLTLTWGTHPAGAEGTAAFSEWGSSGLPEVGDDVILKWIGIPAEESSFPILVNSWEAHRQLLRVARRRTRGAPPRFMLRFFSLTAEGAGRGLCGGAGARARGVRGRRGPCAHVHRQAACGLPLGR